MQYLMCCTSQLTVYKHVKEKRLSNYIICIRNYRQVLKTVSKIPHVVVNEVQLKIIQAAWNLHLSVVINFSSLGNFFLGLPANPAQQLLFLVVKDLKAEIWEEAHMSYDSKHTSCDVFCITLLKGRVVWATSSLLWQKAKEQGGWMMSHPDLTTSLHKFTFSRLSSRERETCASKKITHCSLQGERKNLDNLYAHWVKTQVKIKTKNRKVL